MCVCMREFMCVFNVCACVHACVRAPKKYMNDGFRFEPIKNEFFSLQSKIFSFRVRANLQKRLCFYWGPALGLGKGISILSMLEVNKLAPTASFAICSIFSTSSDRERERARARERESERARERESERERAEERRVGKECRSRWSPYH